MIGLIGAKQLKIKDLRIEGDSKIIINQVTENLDKIRKSKENSQKVMEEIKFFDNLEFQHIYRDKNKRADELANIAMDTKNK